MKSNRENGRNRVTKDLANKSRSELVAVPSRNLVAGFGKKKKGIPSFDWPKKLRHAPAADFLAPSKLLNGRWLPCWPITVRVSCVCVCFRESARRSAGSNDPGEQIGALLVLSHPNRVPRTSRLDQRLERRPFLFPECLAIYLRVTSKPVLFKLGKTAWKLGKWLGNPNSCLDMFHK